MYTYYVYTHIHTYTYTYTIIYLYNILYNVLRAGGGVHLHHAIYSSTEKVWDTKLIKIIT